MQIQKIIFILITICISNSTFASDKLLILAEGNSWAPLMPKNLIANEENISKLPFNGFVMVGNTYTHLVMNNTQQISYDSIWNEVKGLKGLYKNKYNFLQINLEFPGDFWDKKVWDNVAKNFGIVAKVAKDLGFAGIIFDDEPYNKKAHKMNNYKFPSENDVKNNPNKYKEWQKKGKQPSWVDKLGYCNDKYTFKKHMDKISANFKSIMQAMIKEYPNITVLVYNGPSFAHINTNKERLLLTDVGWSREHEYKGPMFVGLKSGLNKKASLHDMGESYKYRNKKEFEWSYKWRKYDIAKNKNNDDLDSDIHWVVPKEQRRNWSKKIHVGFMVFNKGEKSSYPQYDTRRRSSASDIGNTLKFALKRSDKYVIYYCQDQNWLMPTTKENPVQKEWLKMIYKVTK